MQRHIKLKDSIIKLKELLGNDDYDDNNINQSSKSESDSIEKWSNMELELMNQYRHIYQI